METAQAETLLSKFKDNNNQKEPSEGQQQESRVGAALETLTRVWAKVLFTQTKERSDSDLRVWVS